jgi:SAM-dependent methyltransferase
VDRSAWLRERRRIAEERDDTLHAATYDQQEWGRISPTHRRFVAELIRRCPPGGRILDAACGTGKYFGRVLEAGRRVLGTDQSAGMLAQARAKHPDVPTEKLGLQELAFDGDFDAAMCVDAMEHVFPEDWPLVLANLRRALRPGGPLYLTVELADEQQKHDQASTVPRVAKARVRSVPLPANVCSSPSSVRRRHPWQRPRLSTTRLLSATSSPTMSLIPRRPSSG